jgi:hypothetical protein
MTHEVDCFNGTEFSMTLAATTTGIAAGNLVAAAAAASTNFALFNPLGSGRVLVLSRLYVGVISGTPVGGPLFHGLFFGASTVAPSGTIVCNRITGGGLSATSVAKGYASAAGAALTGGPAPSIIRASSLSFTATAQAEVSAINCVEDIEGDIIIPAGYGWVPLWAGAGTAILNAYTISWKERVGQ